MSSRHEHDRWHRESSENAGCSAVVLVLLAVYFVSVLTQAVIIRLDTLECRAAALERGEVFAAPPPSWWNLINPLTETSPC